MNDEARELTLHAENTEHLWNADNVRHAFGSGSEDARLRDALRRDS